MTVLTLVKLKIILTKKISIPDCQLVINTQNNTMKLLDNPHLYGTQFQILVDSCHHLFRLKGDNND